MSGTVNIARSIFDHATFADEAKTEREAWIWMIMEASWKPRTRRVGNAIVETERGQLAASVRFLASAWKWTAPKVQRYLKRLEKMEMIRSQADTGVTVITICNYDEYQSPTKASDTDAIQQRYSSDTNEKKDEIREEGNKDANASMSDCPQPKPPAFDEFWSVWPLGKVNKQGAKQAFTRLSRQDRLDAISNAVEWCRRWRDANPTLNHIHPATYLNKRRWEDERAPSQPSLTLIPGGPHVQSPQQNRRLSNADASNLAIAVAGRTRPAPVEDWI